MNERKRDINNIIFPKYKYNIKEPKNKKSIIGFDTETEKGKAFIMAFHNGKKGEVFIINNFYDLIEHFYCKPFTNTINFFYNLQFDYQALIKHLSTKNLNELAMYNQSIIFYEDKGYLIKIIPKKLFKIGEIKLGDDKIIAFNGKCKIITKHGFLRFYDLAQYYNYVPLEKLAIKYNLKRKVVVDDIEHLDKEKYLNDIYYKLKIDERILGDSEITQNLAQIRYNARWKVLPCNEFYSKATLSQRKVLSSGYNHPIIPKKIIQMFLLAYNGGRFELMKKGYFPNVYEDDINSAYPFAISKLIRIDKNGYWQKVNNGFNEDAHFGVYKIQSDLNGDYITPLKYTLDNLLVFPSGNFTSWIDKNEVELLEKYGYDYKIKEGYEYIHPEPILLFEWIKNIYTERIKNKEKDYLFSDELKITMNGIYGKFIQLIPICEFRKTSFNELSLVDIININNVEIGVFNHQYRAGILFNPVYGCYIPSFTRCKLFNDTYKYQKDIIGFQTDSIKSIRKLPLKRSNKMGEYEIKANGEEGIFIASGISKVGDKVKFRGFDTKIKLDVILKNDVNETYIQRVCSLKQCGKKYELKTVNGTKKLNFDDINLFENVKRDINLNCDKKRIWDDKFKKPSDIFKKQIDSMPLVIK